MQYLFLIVKFTKREDQQTFVLVYTNNHHTLVSSNPDQFVYRTNSPPGQFAQKNHSFNVVVFQQIHVCSHFSDASNVHHDDIVDFWVLVFVKSTTDRHFDEEGNL